MPRRPSTSLKKRFSDFLVSRLGLVSGLGLGLGLGLGVGRLCRDDDGGRMPVYAVVRWYWGSGGAGHPRQLQALGLGRRASRPRAIPHGRFFPVRSHEEIVAFPQYGRNRRQARFHC